MRSLTLPRVALRKPVLMLGAVLISASTSAQSEVDKIVEPGQVGDDFGRAFDVSGDWMIVGGTDAGELQSNAGTAFVFQRRGERWVFTQQLDPAPPHVDGAFGWSVAMDGNRALIGEPHISTTGGISTPGWVHTYELQGTTWVPTTVLPGPSVGFGTHLDVDGDRALIGSNNTTVGQVVDGDAWVYDFDGTDWVLDEMITSPTIPNPGLGFGHDVALDGDRALIGEPGDEGPGRAHLFERGPTGWELVETFTKPFVEFPGELAIFGYQLDLSGDRAIIAGSNFFEPQVSVFAFEEGPSGWGAPVRIDPVVPEVGGVFGGPIRVEGDRALVGRWVFSPSVEPAAAHLYEFDAGSWNPVARLSASDGEWNNNLAEGDLWLGPDSVLVGASRALVDGTYRGAIYEYDTESELCGRPAEISLIVGGSHDFDLNAGVAHEGELYWILGTTSGTTPGQGSPPFVLPLNFSSYFLFTLTNPNTWIADSLSTLDAAGQTRTASITLPPGLDPGLAGVTFHHAAALLSLATLDTTLVTNPVALTLQP